MKAEAGKESPGPISYSPFEARDWLLSMFIGDKMLPESTTANDEIFLQKASAIVIESPYHVHSHA